MYLGEVGRPQGRDHEEPFLRDFVTVILLVAAAGGGLQLLPLGLLGRAE